MSTSFRVWQVAYIPVSKLGGWLTGFTIHVSGPGRWLHVSGSGRWLTGFAIHVSVLGRWLTGFAIHVSGPVGWCINLL